MRLAERAGERALAEPIEPPAQPEAKLARLDPNLLFDRLARTAKDLIAIKTRLAAGKLPAAPREETESPADPRRPAILEWLHTEIAAAPRPKPERAELARQVETRVTEHLAEDPGLTLPGGAIIHAICQEFGLTFNARTMRDELLLRPGQPFPKPTIGNKNVDDEDDDDEEGEFSLHGPDPP